MSELFSTGVSRVVYRAEVFAEGKTVTAYFWSPTLVKSALQTYTELETGLYYLDYDFTVVGTYLSLLFENAVAKAANVYRVSALGVSAAAVANAVHNKVVEGTITLKQAQCLLLAVLTGKASGGGSNTLTFRDTGDTKDRLVATVDLDGNRLAIPTRDGT